MAPYLSYSLAVWGQMSSFHLMYFLEARAHAVPLFISSKILHINMLLLQTVSFIMFNVPPKTVPTNSLH